MFRLALQLGRTVNELTSTLDAAELVEWMAFYRIDPWGGYRTDLAAATIAATMANIKRAPNQTAYSTDDFIPYQRVPESIDHAAISAGCKMMFSSLKNRGQANVNNTSKPS
ncbi:MAG: DUF4035 domain-containing protein [Flavobacteriales bacterium]